MEPKTIKKYGILKVLEEEKKYYLFLPGKKLIEISSAREVDILDQFEIISIKEVGNFIIEVAKHDGGRYLIVKKHDILSTRGYDLVEIYPESRKVVMFQKSFLSSINLPRRYTIRNGKVRTV